MSEKALIIGGGIAGVQVALELADSNIKVTFVEESNALQIKPGNNGDKSIEVLNFMPMLLKANWRRPFIRTVRVSTMMIMRVGNRRQEKKAPADGRPEDSGAIKAKFASFKIKPQGTKMKPVKISWVTLLRADRFSMFAAARLDSSSRNP